ncbi:S-layer homology domain-containing protein [Paenibacillus sp. CAU 1782]
MRETSNTLSKQNSQQPKQFRGGEKKVMKKSLSLLVAIAMVFSMFATVVSAAGPAEGQTAGQYLNQLGVIKGNGTDLKEDQTWKRQDIVVLLSRLLGVEAAAKATAKGHEFTDVTDANYDGYITWAVKENLVQGKGNGKFGYNDELKTQEFYALVLRAFKLDVAYDDVPAKAVELKLAAEGTDFAAIPTRGATYSTVVTALNTVVPGTGKTLGEVLGLIQVTELAISTVTQTGKGEITVAFNKATTADEQKALTAKVANGAVPYTVTTKWTEEGRNLVLTSTYLPAAKYTVTVGEFAAVEVTIVDEVPTKLEIGATTLQKADGQDLKVKLFNQFDKEVTNASLNITVFNATYGKSVPVSSGKVNLLSDNVSRVGDTVVVNASNTTGLNASKSFQVVAGSAATVVKLSAPTPLKDKTRISVNEEGIVLPYTLTDQYGGNIVLTDTSGYVTVGADRTVVLNGITFLVSDINAVTAFSVDKDGVLRIKTGSQAGTVVVSAMNAAVANAFSSINFNVSSSAAVKSLNLQIPATLVAGSEEFVIPYTAIDTFDQPIAAKDLSLSNVTINSAGVDFAAGYPRLNAKGELVGKFVSVTDNRKYAFITAISTTTFQQVGSVQIEVNKDATVEKINGLNIAKYFANSGSAELKADQITYRDSYGRTKKVANLSDVTIALTTPANNTDALTLTGADLAAHASQTGEVKVKITYGTNADTSETFTINVIKNEDVKNFALKAVGTLFAGTAPTGIAAEKYEKTVELVGKTASNDDVVINQTTAFDLVTSSKPSIVQVAVASPKTVKALDAGTSVLAAFKDGKKLAEVEVTASKDAPVATTVSFENGEYHLTTATNFAAEIKVKDQYGVDLTAGTHFAGFLSSDNTKVATVSGTTVTPVAGAKGTATITYLTTTGASATTVVYQD